MVQLSCTISRNLVHRIADWETLDGDMISRLSWMCVLLESGPVVELGLSRTGIVGLQDSVPLPLFISKPEDMPKTDREVFIQYHFLAQITLKALMDRINNTLQLYRSPFQVESTSTDILVTELSMQLELWRDHLPIPLQWTESTALRLTTHLDHPETVLLRAEGIPYKMLGAELILTASLQTRYKLAQYLIWRPYIYKALHFEGSITSYDLRNCEKAILACTEWPLTLALYQGSKRLLPHLYEYSYTFFGILVLFHVCSFSKGLRPLLDVPETRDLVERSKALFLQWMCEMEAIHPVAHWCWQLIRLMYADHPVVKAANADQGVGEQKQNTLRP